MTDPLLDRLNTLDAAGFRAELRKCCASGRWLDAVAAQRPFSSTAALLTAADAAWGQLDDADWLEAMEAAVHPDVPGTDAGTRGAALTALRLYRERFGYPFVNARRAATGEELLMRVRIRLGLDPAADLRAAHFEQRRWTEARLRELLESGMRTTP